MEYHRFVVSYKLYLHERLLDQFGHQGRPSYVAYPAAEEMMIVVAFQLLSCGCWCVVGVKVLLHQNDPLF